MSLHGMSCAFFKNHLYSVGRMTMATTTMMKIMMVVVIRMMMMMMAAASDRGQ